MIRFIIKRLLQAIPAILVIFTITFVMLKLAPGGPFSTEKDVDPATLKNLKAYYGLDKPLIVQYFLNLKNLLYGNFGPSFRYKNRSVNEVIAGAFPISFELGLWAMLLALLIGLTAGMIAAIKPNSLSDYLPMSLAMIGICLPTFVIGPLLLLLFGLKLNLVNATGWNTFGDRLLPSLTLALPYAAYIARLFRSGMLEILNQDFIRTARAKGLTSSAILFRHAFRGGVLPVVSFLGPACAGIITGSFVIEKVFQIPGLGQHFINAGFNRDYSMVIGLGVFYGVLIIVFNLLVDIVQVWLNPKLKFSD
ncbi:MAG: ABC transporter permease subunit [Chitinivibrionales bacterium]|nr:ABC transporter permease subunit [Chitinivibrionales bacterium]